MAPTYFKLEYVVLSHDDFLHFLNSVKRLNSEQIKVVNRTLKNLENKQTGLLSDEERDFIQSILYAS